MKYLKLYITSILLLGSNVIFAETNSEYHFDSVPFVHPAIIEDLSSWESDRGDQVVSIDIDHSNNSNRYFGEFQVEQTEHANMKMYHNSGNPYVSIGRSNACEEGSNERSLGFGYDLIGKINDIYILHTSEQSCGSGVWHDLILLKIEQDIALEYQKDKERLDYSRPRTIIRKLKEIPLGDRYEGYVEIQGQKIYISKDDRNTTSSIIEKDTVIELVK